LRLKVPRPQQAGGHEFVRRAIPGRRGPHGYLRRNSASKISHAGRLDPLFSRSAYIAYTMSLYGAASSTKRFPSPLTITQPGKARSTNKARRFSLPAMKIVGAHQA